MMKMHIDSQVLGIAFVAPLVTMLVTALGTTAGVSAQAPTVTRSSVPILGSATIVADEHSRMDALVDGDLDGKMDAIGFWTSEKDRTKGDLRYMRNDGSGNLTEITLLAGVKIGTNNPTPDVFLGDWDGDGNQDCGLDHQDGTFSFFHSRQLGPVLAETVTLAVTGTITGVVGHDFNDDKKDDVAILTSGTLYIFLNSVGVPRNLGHSRSTGGTNLRLIDIGNDGADDLMHIAGDQIHLLNVVRKPNWNGNRVDAVTLHAGITVGSIYRLMAACGDIDGDKDDDVVAFNPARSYQVLRQDATGKFTQESWLTGGPATAFADIDGDGDLDGICCGGGGGGPYAGAANLTPARFEVAVNRNGKFDIAFGAQNIGARHIAGAADMDGDGRVDLVAGRGILFNRNVLTSEFDTQLVGPNRAWIKVDNIGDTDGDGDLDVHNTFYHEYYRNPGNGSVQLVSLDMPTPAPGVNYYSSFHFRGDWDGDGDDDMLVGTYDTAFRGMHFLRNTDGKKFVDEGLITPAPDSLHPFYKTIAAQSAYFAVDLNKDGLVDLITHNSSSTPTRAFLSQGDGKFTEIAHGLYTTLREVRDLNRDGYPDIVASSTSYGVDIYWGQKGGATLRQELLRPLYATDFKVDDYDGDGDLDIFSSHDKKITLNENRGTGGFVQHVLFETGNSHSKVFVADLDGDGRRDVLAFPGTHSNTAIIATGTATGFAYREQLMMDTKFVLADTDDDGDVDIVGDFMLRNVTYHGPSAGSMREFGVATSGTSGIKPLLGVTGPFREGHDSSLLLRHGNAGSLGLIVVGVDEVNLVNFPLPGVNTYILPQPISVLVNLDSHGRWSLRAKLPVGIGGTTLLFHAVVTDSSAPAGILTPNAVRVRYGN